MSDHPDVFGHGIQGSKRFGVVGTVGDLRTLRDEARQILLATYAEPQTASLHVSVPIPTWPNPARNDEIYDPSGSRP